MSKVSDDDKKTAFTTFEIAHYFSKKPNADRVFTGREVAQILNVTGHLILDGDLGKGENDD